MVLIRSSECGRGHLVYEVFHGTVRVPTPADAPFKEGDIVECIETFVSKFDPDYVPQNVGDRFVVQAYLEGYDYLILEDTTVGYVNASRFRKV